MEYLECSTVTKSCSSMQGLEVIFLLWCRNQGVRTGFAQISSAERQDTICLAGSTIINSCCELIIEHLSWVVLNDGNKLHLMQVIFN